MASRRGKVVTTAQAINQALKMVREELATIPESDRKMLDEKQTYTRFCYLKNAAEMLVGVRNIYKANTALSAKAEQIASKS